MRALCRRPRRRPWLLPLLPVQLLFWLPFFLYGLTYDQTLVVRPTTAGGMIVYLGASAVLLAAAVVLLAGLQDALLRRALRKPLLAGLAAAAALALFPATLTLAPRALEPWAATAAPAPPLPVVAARGASKVVLIGLDGADPGVLETLVGRGELPTFARLIAEGASGPLTVLPGANSAVLWASIYTGATPAVHGIQDFYRIALPGVPSGVFPVHRTFWKEAAGALAAAGLAERTTVTRGDLLAPPLWEVADWAGLSTTVVDGYLCSFPAFAPRVAGSAFVAYGADGFARQLEAGTLSASELPLFFQPAASWQELRTVLDRPDFEWQSAALLRLLERDGQPRLLNLYTHEPDTIQHQWWRSWEPERFLRPPAGEGDRIPAVYRSFDRFLGALLPRLEAGTALVIVSDHGHAATLVHALDSQHRHGPPGILLLHGAPVRPGVALADAGLYDLAPSVLHLLGLPVPADLPGRVLEQAFSDQFLRQNPVRQTTSYAALGPVSGGAKRHRLLDRREIEKLKALGYI